MVDAPISYLQSPAVPINQAVNMLGQPGKVIGDINDGTAIAEAARYVYGQGLRQLLRTAHWGFARKRVKLQLLGDATGNSAPPISNFVESPWAYAYAWPTDAVQGRWMPWTPTNAQPLDAQGIPITTGASAGVFYPMTPGTFLVASSDQYPIETGFTPWNQLPDIQRTEGLGPTSRKVILTNCCNAEFVYTRLVTSVEEWDSLFRQAFVTMLALALAPIAIEDPKLRMSETDRLKQSLKMAVADARVANGNESTTSASTDHLPNWITARGGYWYGGAAGFNQGFSGYNFLPFDASMSWCSGVY